MDANLLELLVSHMQNRGFRFLPGLTDTEIGTAEAKWAFHFPPDLRLFLQIGMPAPLEGHHIEHKAFPNWRSTSRDDELYIRYRMNWPVDTLLWDIEYNAFWLANWGARPRNVESACQIGRNHCLHAPRLIPIYAHHYIPADPAEAGNPVFSMRGSDTAVCGNVLQHYLATTFQLPVDCHGSEVKTISFWSELAEQG